MCLQLDFIIVFYYCEAVRVRSSTDGFFFFKPKVKVFIILNIHRLACVEYPLCLGSLSTFSGMDNLAYLIDK